MNIHRAQQLMGIRGRQMVYELNGIACLSLAREHKPQQMIMRGRQFGEDTNEFYVIEAAVASLSTRAAAALRREHQLTKQATVVLRTNRHKPGYQRISHTVRFRTPTADTGTITSTLIDSLAEAFNPKISYHRADILLHDFVPEGGLQTDLLGTVDLTAAQASKRKMQVMDSINQQYGHGTVTLAAETLSTAWRPRKQLVSPRYTSAWDELPEVHLR
jgi:DNA polymerase V